MDEFSSLLDSFPRDLRASEHKKGRWTLEEDHLLSAAVEELGERQWGTIAERVTGRSPVQCQHRWTKALKPGLVKGPWNAEEDLKLLAWVQKQGTGKWAACAETIPGRSAKQCKERWNNTLDPNVKKGDWEGDEDSTIFRLFHEIGPKWTVMANYLPGRTENSIKNRFYSTIRKVKPRKIHPISSPNAVPAPKLTVSMQLKALFEKVQMLEQLVSKTQQQITRFEHSLESSRDLEEITQEVLF